SWGRHRAATERRTLLERLDGQERAGIAYRGMTPELVTVRGSEGADDLGPAGGRDHAGRAGVGNIEDDRPGIAARCQRMRAVVGVVLQGPVAGIERERPAGDRPKRFRRNPRAARNGLVLGVEL